MSSPVTLTPTSYIVLGLLRNAGPSTPYALKQGLAGSVGHFWSVPHSQVYAEPARLARGGYVREEREAGGRRRRTYAIAEAGIEALEAWLADPDVAPAELRDPALLKLFFGADPAGLADSQLAHHRGLLAEYERLRDALAGHAEAAGPLHTLEAGIQHARQWIAYWEARSRPPSAT